MSTMPGCIIKIARSILLILINIIDIINSAQKAWALSTMPGHYAYCTISAIARNIYTSSNYYLIKTLNFHFYVSIAYFKQIQLHFIIINDKDLVFFLVALEIQYTKQKFFSWKTFQHFIMCILIGKSTLSRFSTQRLNYLNSKNVQTLT